MNIQTTICHLNYDVLKTILLLVVASAGGVTDLAKTMAVCKTFATFGDDKDLLKVTNFKNYSLPNSVEHCQHIRSLLIRCAEAGNVGAQYMLAQVILIRFSQLLDQEYYCYKRQRACLLSDQARFSRVEEQDSLPPFLCCFMPEQATNSDTKKGKFAHFELVSLFLSRCTILDHVSMLRYVQNYVAHFAVGIKQCTKFNPYFNYMTSILQGIVDVGRNRRIWYSPRLLNNCPIQPQMRNAAYVKIKLETNITNHSLNRVGKLSQSKWEELKRECHFIVEDLLSLESYEKPLEENAKVLDMGKRFFYYLAFSGPVTSEIDLALDRDGDNLWAISMRCAKRYYSLQHKAAAYFDDIFVTCECGKRKREAI